MHDVPCLPLANQTSQTQNLKRVISRASYGREGRPGIDGRRIMQSLRNGLGEAQILFILVTHESSAKGRAEGKDRFHQQGKECPDPPLQFPAAPSGDIFISVSIRSAGRISFKPSRGSEEEFDASVGWPLEDATLTSSRLLSELLTQRTYRLQPPPFLGFTGVGSHV